MRNPAIGFVLALAAVGITFAASAGSHKKDKIETESQTDVMPAFVDPSDAPDPKHKPKIDAPTKVNAGEWFPVTIHVGFKQTHPSLVEHHVRYIALAKGNAEIARTYLHPVHSAPRVTYWIALEESTTLKAIEEPTHASQFFTEHKVEVVKKKTKKKAKK